MQVGYSHGKSYMHSSVTRPAGGNHTIRGLT